MINRPLLTPAQTLHRILTDYGHCAASKIAFGTLLRISGSNVYAYLRDTDDERRIRVRPETLHAWCWAVRKVTDLRIAVRLDPDGSLDLETWGFDASGREIERRIHHTIHNDFSVVKPWKPEWTE